MIEGGGFEPPIVVGLDLGTQSTRCLAFDGRGRHLVTASRPTPMRRLADGGEYDPQLLWTTAESCLGEAIAALPHGAPVAGIAVASIGETCVLVDADGRATAPALLWYDRRTEAAAAAIEARIGRERLFALTGHRVDPTFGLCKLMWMRDNWPEAFRRARRVLNVADWIAFQLCGSAATDFTLASRTLVLDIRARRWSQEILDALGFSPELFAPLAAGGRPLGPVRPALAAALGLARPPIVGVGGHDHLCGMFAAGAARTGVLLDSMGTAEAFVQGLAQPLSDPAILDRGYFQGRIEADRQLAYIGAGINASGGAIEWFRDLFAAGISHAELIAEAEEVPAGAGGVSFLPHLASAPPPDPDVAARGAFVGLTTGTPRGMLFRAILEGLAFEARRIIDGMAHIAGVPPPEDIRLIGGSSRNRLFVEIKASVLGRALTILDQPEATALGAALLGGLAAGVWPDLDGALAALDQPHHEVLPNPQWAETYERAYREVHLQLAPALRNINRSIAGHEPPRGPLADKAQTDQ